MWLLGATASLAVPAPICRRHVSHFVPPSLVVRRGQSARDDVWNNWSSAFPQLFTPYQQVILLGVLISHPMFERLQPIPQLNLAPVYGRPEVAKPLPQVTDSRIWPNCGMR